MIDVRVDTPLPKNNQKWTEEKSSIAAVIAARLSCPIISPFDTYISFHVLLYNVSLCYSLDYLRTEDLHYKLVIHLFQGFTGLTF